MSRFDSVTRLNFNQVGPYDNNGVAASIDTPIHRHQIPHHTVLVPALS